jgi:hypothetical protein
MKKRSEPDGTSLIDPENLLIARLWIARLGEGDVQGWWRTNGLLGADGAFVGPRVLPLTHPTGRARLVFAVAAHACGERYPDTQARHLFRLDPETEDRLDALLISKLEDAAFWKKIIGKLEAIKTTDDPRAVLMETGLITDADAQHVDRLKLGPEGRSLSIDPATSADETLRRLAAGFLRSSKGELTVPYLSA